MTLTIGTWVIPLFLTLVCLGMLFRPYRSQGTFDFGPVLRLFWVVPIGFIWAFYFGLLLLFR